MKFNPDMSTAPTNERILIQSKQGEIYAAIWAKNTETGHIAWRIASFGPDGDCVLILPEDCAGWAHIETGEAIAKLTAQVEALKAELERARAVFEGYSSIHALKGTPDGDSKSIANKEHADRIAKVLASMSNNVHTQSAD